MDAEPFSQGRLRPGLLGKVARAAFLVFALVKALRFGIEALPRYLPRDWSRAHELDALQDWLGARLYVAGESPYTKRGLEKIHAGTFGHPPTAPFWFIPLAHFDKPLAAELVSFSTWLFLVLLIYVCAKEVKFPAPIALTILVFGWALTTEGMVNHWQAIQSSVHIATGLVACWAFLRRDRQVPAGIALGIAATFKLFPGVVMLFLLLARRFRAFAAASATYLAVGAVMSATYGVESWKLFLKMQGPAADLWIGSLRNASLHGMVLRLFYPVCVSAAQPPTRMTNYTTSAIAAALLVLAAFLSLRSLRRAREEDPRAVDVPFSLFSVLSVFVNPWVWEHYWVLLIQPAFVVANTLYRVAQSSFRAWLDEELSVRVLVLKTSGVVLGAAGIVATMKLIGTQDIRTERFLELYNASKSPWAHRQLHLWEAFNSLPWVIMLVLCYALSRVVPGRLARPTAGGPQRE